MPLKSCWNLVGSGLNASSLLLVVTVARQDIGVLVQGQLQCVHDDGTEVLASAGDAYYFAPGHDGWVVGDESVIGYEFSDTGKDFGPWKTSP